MRLKIVLTAITFIVCVFAFTLALRTPQNDRAWDTEFERTTTADFDEDRVILNNVRDFTYADSSLTVTTWVDEIQLDPKNIVRAWFVLEPFAEWGAVGHTFLTFEFMDGTAYSFSVEARRERGETYSALRGLFREYELAYTWGTERDFITRRLLYLNHPVRMYPLSISAEQTQKLFSGLIEKTNSLAVNPRFYNTLSANCTNILAEIANDITPETIPYDISWNLPGFSDRFLFRIGMISIEESIEATRLKYDLTDNRRDVLDIANLPHAEFGKQLRQLLPK